MDGAPYDLQPGGWLAPAFAGDGNGALRQVQATAFAGLAGHLYFAARARYLQAARLLQVEPPLATALRAAERVELAALQDAYTLIATEYRFTHDDGGQIPLPFTGRQAYEAILQERWGRFFWQETTHLVDSDAITLALCLAVTRMATPDGTTARAHLDTLLQERYGPLAAARAAWCAGHRARASRPPSPSPARVGNPPLPEADPEPDLTGYAGPLPGFRLEDRALVGELCLGVRRLLARPTLRPVEIHHLARLLGALERLPCATPGVGLRLTVSWPETWGPACTITVGPDYLELTDARNVPFFAGFAARDVYDATLAEWLEAFASGVRSSKTVLAVEEFGDAAAPAWPPGDGAAAADRGDPWDTLRDIEGLADEDMWAPGDP